MKQLEAAVSSHTRQDEAILENATEIKLAVRSYERIKMIRMIEQSDIDIKSYREQLRQRAADCLVGGWKPEHEDAVRAVDNAALRAE